MSDLTSNSTDREIMAYLGARLRGLRKRQRLTMLDVARRASLHRSTVSAAEEGDNPTLLTLVRLLRVYGRLGALDEFLPEPELSPMSLIRARRGS